MQVISDVLFKHGQGSAAPHLATRGVSAARVCVRRGRLVLVAVLVDWWWEASSTDPSRHEEGVQRCVDVEVGQQPDGRADEPSHQHDRGDHVRLVRDRAGQFIEEKAHRPTAVAYPESCMPDEFHLSPQRKKFLQISMSARAARAGMTQASGPLGSPPPWPLASSQCPSAGYRHVSRGEIRG